MTADPTTLVITIAMLPTKVAPIEPMPTRLQQTLPVIDLAFSLMALALIMIIGMSWSARPNLATLANIPWRPNRIYEDAVALAVVVYLLAALLLSTVASGLTGGNESLIGSMFVGSGAQVIGIGACLMIAAKRFDGGMPRFCFGERTTPRRTTILMIAVVVLLALGLCPLIRDASVALINLIAPEYEFESHATLRALGEPGHPFGVVVALWAGAAIVAPIAEECFFRGLLQTFLANVVPNRWVAIVLTSIIFGAIHFPQPYAISALIFLAVLIGYAYERTGSVFVAIVIHALFNLKTLIWVTLGSSTA